MQKPIFRCGNTSIWYLNHASILVASPGTTLIIDPFFSRRFLCNGRWEVQVSRPHVRLDEIRRCDAVFITHLHGDHFDIEAVTTLVRRRGAILFGGADVVTYATHSACGISPERSHQIDQGDRVKIGPFRVEVFPNKRNERDQPCERFSFAINFPDGIIFHSGDSHGFSPTWKNLMGKVEIAFLWLEDIEEMISGLRPRKVFLIHCGRFRPGKFSCNQDVPNVKRHLKERFPDCEILTV
ncbi:MAG: MBL fold metallo-hydrolase [Chloroflexi bacterium]|nr:MBL fold metallo-hydrolase [Chloroflexota bacterium]